MRRWLSSPVAAGGLAPSFASRAGTGRAQGHDRGEIQGAGPGGGPKVEDAGSEALIVVGDITTEQDAERCVNETLDRFGRVDIVVNAIGGEPAGFSIPPTSIPRRDWDWIFELNLRSKLPPTQYAARAMIDAGRGGRVLNISSVRGQLGIDAGYSAYVAAKGAIDALTRQWATEWAGINLSAIAPTFIDTPQVAMLLDDPEFKANGSR